MTCGAELDNYVLESTALLYFGNARNLCMMQGRQLLATIYAFEATYCMCMIRGTVQFNGDSNRPNT
jgi:hypothetical protein